MKPANLTLSPSLHDQFKEVVEEIPRASLNLYLMDHAIGDPLFAHEFLVEFAHFNSHESLSLYRQHIRYILNKYAGKDGYITSDNTMDAACSVGTVLYTAVKHHQIANYRSAMRMCCCRHG